MTIAIIQLVLFTFYISFVWIRDGVQRSLSESWYILDKPFRWMFTVVLCFGIGILHCTYGNLLLFLSGAFLCFVGAASDYRAAKLTKIVHYVGAVMSIALSLVHLSINEIYWPLSMTLFMIIILPLIDNRFWWLEIIAFYSILGGLIQLKY